MRLPGSDFGYLEPARDFRRTASIVLVAGAIGATAAAGAVFALLGGPTVDSSLATPALTRSLEPAVTRTAAPSQAKRTTPLPYADADGKGERPTGATVVARRRWSTGRRSHRRTRIINPGGFAAGNTCSPARAYGGYARLDDQSRRRSGGSWQQNGRGCGAARKEGEQKAGAVLPIRVAQRILSR